MAGAKKRKQEVVADEQAAAEEQPHDDEDAGSPERKRNAPTQQEDAKETEITEELDSFGRSKDTREAVTVMVTVPTTSTEIIVAKTSFSKKAEPFLSSSTLLLTGHTEAVYSIAFDPTGCYLASGGMDRHIMLWDVKGGNNYNVLEGHKNAILEVKFSGTRIISCSADKSVAVWDANKGCRIRKLTDHSAIVNCCAVAGKNSPNAFASGSDDATVVIWDQRTKTQVTTIYHDYQITSLCMTEDGQSVFCGGIDNLIRRWDLRMNNGEEPLEKLTLPGCTETVTGLSLSPHDNGLTLLSNSMDSKLRGWNVRPFVPGTDGNPGFRCEKVYQGVHHGAEKLLLRCGWSPDGERVACGSSDRVVRIWDASTCQMQYALPGHKGSVNEVIFNPVRPDVIASCGSDKQIFLGELV